MTSIIQLLHIYNNTIQKIKSESKTRCDIYE